MEIALVLPKSHKEYVEKCINEAIEDTNREIQLNVPISCGIDFGMRYSDIH